MHTSLEGQQQVFRGNYTHFLVRLFGVAVLCSPLLYLLARALGALRPLMVTLTVVTVGLAIAVAIFFLIVLRRREIGVDEFGLNYKDELRCLYLPWSSVRSITLHSVEAFFKPFPLCYVRVGDDEGNSFAFASFGSHPFGVRREVSFGEPPYPILDVRDADLLLALIAQETGKMEQLPVLMTRREELLEPEEWADPEEPAEHREEERSPSRVGFWAFLVKIGLKVLAYVGKGIKLLAQGAKLGKIGLVGISAGIYAAIINWKFAALLTLILLVHELGHVWAMKRAGMKVKGIYFIPFLGAATVTEDLWPDWNTQAMVNLAGPLAGLILSAAMLVLHIITGFRYPFLAAVAAWGALLNLLNLLPVSPLDGGRVFTAIAYSLRSRRAFAATFAVLLLGVGLGLYLQLMLIYLVCAIGLVEFTVDRGRRMRAERFALLRASSVMDHRDLLFLKSVTAINFGERNSPSVVSSELRSFKMMKMILEAPPMTGRQVWLTLALFAGSFLLLLGMMLLTGALPGASMALEILR